MENKKKCIFCKRSPPEVRLTREHLLPKWMKKKITNKKTFFYKGGYSTSPTNLPLKYEVRQMNGLSPFDLTVSAVCNECNNGWMSIDLEEPIQPLLIDICGGVSRHITSSEASLLARWALKTSIVKALTEKGYFAIPDNHVASVFCGKMPEHVNVWIGCYPDEIGFVSRFQRVMSSQGHRTYIASFQINSLFIHVIGSENEKMDSYYDKEYFSMVEREIGAMINITKLDDGERLVWPPNNLIKITAHELSGIIGHLFYGLPLLVEA